MHMKRDNLISLLFISQRSTWREYVRIMASMLCFTVAVSPFTTNNNKLVLTWTLSDKSLGVCEPFVILTALQKC